MRRITDSLCAFAVLVAVAATLAIPVHAKDRAVAEAALWRVTLDSDVDWYRLTSIGTLLAATDKALSSVDPETGAIAWTRTDLEKSDEGQVVEVEGTPLLLVGQNSGRFKTSTRLVAIDILTGETVWETEKTRGATVGMVPVYDRNMVIVMTSAAAGAAKDKIDLLALDMTTGEAAWEAEYPDPVELYVAEGSGRFSARFDLSGHQPPVRDGDALYFTYAGLHRLDLETGRFAWGVRYDVTDGGLKLANAPALVSGDTVYTSAKGQVRAIDKATGEVRWTSKDFGGAVAEFLLNDGVLYARLGGSFYDRGSKAWALKKPLGVVAIDASTGSAVWKYEGAKDSITNMAFLPEQKTILIADAERLIGLDTTASGKVKEAFKIKLEFKNRLGAAGKTAKAIKFGLGGLSAFGSKSGDTRDFPVALSRRENGTVVVRGKQHVLAFDPATRAVPWAVKYDAPGISGWATIAMAAATAFAYSGYTAQAANSYAGTSENRWANQNRLKTLENYERYVNKRFTATSANDRYVYVLTKVEHGEDRLPGIVAIDMETGTGDRQVALDDKEPDYRVDERTGVLFNLEGKKVLAAYGIR